MHIIADLGTGSGSNSEHINTTNSKTVTSSLGPLSTLWQRSRQLLVAKRYMVLSSAFCNTSGTEEEIAELFEV